jgi:molybdate transport system permease protein
MDWASLWLSLRLALFTSLLLLALGTPLAAWIAFSPRRWKFIVEAIVALPIVLPPTVLGLCVLIALGPHSPLGRWYESATGSRLVFSFQGLLIASVLYSLPFMVQPLAAAFGAVDRRLIEASWCLGQSRSRTFLRIVLPLSRRGVIAGSVLSFAHTLGEFGVVLMVGGNIPGLTRTASISIYDDVQAMEYARAGATAAVLLVISLAVLILVYALQRKPVGGALWQRA